MLANLLPILIASLFGSLHCAAMCGGLVSFTSATATRPGLVVATYHVSRLFVYAGLGAAAGYLGQTLNRQLDFTGLQNFAGLASGVLMIGVALRTWFGKRRAQHEPPSSAARPNAQLRIEKPRPGLLGGLLAWIHGLPSLARGAVLGLTSALLPCGWLYTFVVAAAGRGSPVSGATLMTAFWLGTLPMLVGLGGIARLLSAKFSRSLPQLSTLLLLLLGLGTLVYRNPLDLHPSHPASGDHPRSCH